jgi:hypothetical protein
MRKDRVSNIAEANHRNVQSTAFTMKTTPEVGALGGLYGNPLPRGKFLFSRYEWLSRPVATLLSRTITPLWYLEIGDGDGDGLDIKWTAFRRRSVAILVHPGDQGYEFAVRMANRASDAGAYVLFRPTLPEQLYGAIKQIGKIQIRRVFCSELDMCG